jgi:L-aminoadipate-semialdehyde dehydrogenase
MSEKIERWKERLSMLTELVLPTDYPRQIPARIVESEFVRDIQEETSLAILQLSLQKKTTPFSVLLAAFSALLHRFTGEDDITIGSSSNANPLVLRMNISSTHSISQLIDTVMNTEREALDDEIPFDTLLKAFNDDTYNQSFFKVRFFNMTDTTPDTLASTTTSSSCDMTVFISQTSTLRRLLPIQIKLVYNSLLFSESRIEFMLEQLEQFLTTAALDPQLSINKISLVTPKSVHLPDPTADLNWPGFQGAITDIFARNAQKYPSRTCVVEHVGNEERVFTYKQIDEASNILAHHLIDSGIQREEVVVLYSYRGVDLVVAIMGVLKAGATFSVIDPAYPPARQNIYLQVSQPRGLVVLKKAGVLHSDVEAYIQSELAIKCRLNALELDSTGELHCVHNDTDQLKNVRVKKSVHPGVVLGPDSVGTLSFTSGSTGIPKGVRGRHFSLTHFYPWMMEEFQLSETDRFTMLSGIAHDPIQRDIFTPLFMGAQICIPTSEDIGVPGRLAEWMAKMKITITHLTPAMGQLLSANATHPIPSLRHAFFVGDVLTKRDVMRLQHLANNTHVINMYGTTETQRAVSYLKIPPISLNPGFLTEQKDIMPAGKGMKNVQLLVINNEGLLAGVGEVGEIYVRSGGLAEGYLALPEVTSEKFLINPFSKGNYTDKEMPYYFGCRDRMYRTGDLGRYKPSGDVECTGRADDQVKIRGFRIELKEIDTHLSQFQGIRENVTLVRRDKDEEKVLVSYFVPLAKQLEDVAEFIKEIRNYLKQKLPNYAIPSVFVPLTRMPLTPNGKIDKNALPFPDTALAAAAVESEDLSPLQSSLREVWANLLKTPAQSISLNDNFFDLGGHSILATQLVFEVRKNLAVEAPLGMVYQAPILKDMVAQIDFLRGGDLNMTQSALAAGSQDSLNAIPTKPVATKESAEEVFDYAADLEQMDDPSIASGSLTPCDFAFLQRNPTFFITGVTGFLGAFLVAGAFKKHPNAKIYALARASDDETALKRIVENCKRHLVWQDSWKKNLVAVRGDLGVDQYGISDALWKQLVEEVDVIIHNGALVHWVYPYQKLKGPNVQGTLTALKLATTHHLKPLHFVSSTSVLDTDHYIQKLILGTSVYETDDLQGSRTGLRSGYGQTKWVAEQLIMRAKQRGVPCTIIRPGYIVGDSVRGVTNTDDFIWRLIKGCVQLSQAPRIANVVNMCSVDYVADCVIEVASNPSSIDLGVFHTWNSTLYIHFDLVLSLMIYLLH